MKIGDKVLVVNYQEDVPDMKKYVGQMTEITDIDNYCPNWFSIAADNGMYAWKESWLEIVEVNFNEESLIKEFSIDPALYEE